VAFTVFGLGTCARLGPFAVGASSIGGVIVGGVVAAAFLEGSVDRAEVGLIDVIAAAGIRPMGLAAAFGAAGTVGRLPIAVFVEFIVGSIVVRVVVASALAERAAGTPTFIRVSVSAAAGIRIVAFAVLSFCPAARLRPSAAACRGSGRVVVRGIGMAALLERAIHRLAVVGRRIHAVAFVLVVCAAVAGRAAAAACELPTAGR